jgi:hypothetical protein
VFRRDAALALVREKRQRDPLVAAHLMAMRPLRELGP